MASNPNGAGQRTEDAARPLHKDTHERLHAEFAARFAVLGTRSALLSNLRLVTFVIGASCVAAQLASERDATLWVCVVAVLPFVIAVFAHIEVSHRQAGAAIRRDLHKRHLERTTLEWMNHPPPAARVADDHPYAVDIDLVGPSSLLHRIDTTQTAWGERMLVAWLSAPAAPEVLASRQAAIDELARAVTLRQELEAAGVDARRGSKLSGDGFLEFASQRGWVVGWRRAAPILLPFVTLLVLVGWWLDLLRTPGWWLALAPQLVLVVWTWKTPIRKFAMLDSRRPQLEAFGKMLAVIEHASPEAPLLRELRERLEVAGRPPSADMRALARLAGWADFRYQYLVHPFVNLLLMWDWHVLWALERWNARAGVNVRNWFEVVAEIEALASLSLLRALDRTEFPTIVEAGSGFHAVGLAHPMIAMEQRVANDVSVSGPGHVLVVTGSNMAGKSTLLRAVGLNIALALAGGPVCAKSMRVPIVRLRSSMRIDDSLQLGASYFHAELTRLKIVVSKPAAQPPIFFLFDELLRGTNAGARRAGATAIVVHLISHGALGLVATHDDALCDLVDLPHVRGGNVHLTDAIVNGEMVFDYLLRPGRARTSNALELLARAGIPLASATPGLHPHDLESRTPPEPIRAPRTNWSSPSTR